MKEIYICIQFTVEVYAPERMDTSACCTGEGQPLEATGRSDGEVHPQCEPFSVVSVSSSQLLYMSFIMDLIMIIKLSRSMVFLIDHTSHLFMLYNIYQFYFSTFNPSPSIGIFGLYKVVERYRCMNAQNCMHTITV